MKTILLIDDEPDVLECLGETLLRLNYSIIAMRDGSSALGQINQGRAIDLVITDYLMPGMDGLQFVSHLRKVLPHVPVILLTGCCSLESYCLASSLGIAKYVAKPVRAKELGRLVADALAIEGASSAKARDGAPLTMPRATKERAMNYTSNTYVREARQE